MSSGKNILYRIDRDDKIIAVNEAWDQFALENEGTYLRSPYILNRSLWDFICDRTTQGLYREMLNVVRAGKILRFAFRCDSPLYRRFLEMQITAGDLASVEFYTRTITIELREKSLLLDPTIPRSQEILRMCSWCKKIHTGTEWTDLEHAVTHSKLFDQPFMPTLTHGICDACHRDMKSLIKSQMKS